VQSELHAELQLFGCVLQFLRHSPEEEERSYDSKHLTRVLAPLEAPDAGIDEIRQAFYDYASAIESPFCGLGCLMCNTAVERDALDPGSKRYVAAFLERLTRAFRHALSNAQQAGIIDLSTNLDEMAGFLTTALIGMRPACAPMHHLGRSGRPTMS
jgi:hypothetical protein